MRTGPKWIGSSRFGRKEKYSQSQTSEKIDIVEQRIGVMNAVATAEFVGPKAIL